MSEEIIIIKNAEEARTVADGVNTSKKNKANKWVEEQETFVLDKVTNAAKLGQYNCSYEWTLSLTDLENIEVYDPKILQDTLSNYFEALGFKVSIEGWIYSQTTCKIKLMLNWNKEEESVE